MNPEVEKYLNEHHFQNPCVPDPGEFVIEDDNSPLVHPGQRPCFVCQAPVTDRRYVYTDWQNSQSCLREDCKRCGLWKNDFYTGYTIERIGFVKIKAEVLRIEPDTDRKSLIATIGVNQEKRQAARLEALAMLDDREMMGFILAIKEDPKNLTNWGAMVDFIQEYRSDKYPMNLESLLEPANRDVE